MNSSQSAVIAHNVVSLRSEPNGRAEQVSQAILGDSVRVLAESGDYLQIQTRDAYTGWALRQHVALYSGEEESLSLYEDDSLVYVTGAFADFRDRKEGRLLTKLVFGTRVEVLADTTGEQAGYLSVKTGDGRVGYVREAALTSTLVFQLFDRHALCDRAEQFIGTPYLWGGGTPFGFDCSGFVQRLYSLYDVILPRDAYLQAKSPLGEKLAEDDVLEAGDLVFFCGDSDPRKRGITHVGMMLDAERVLHASGREGVVIALLRIGDLAETYTYRGAWRYNG